MARHKDSERTDYIIQNWLRNRNTIEFLGIWEQLNNPDFKPIEFDGFRNGEQQLRFDENAADSQAGATRHEAPHGKVRR